MQFTIKSPVSDKLRTQCLILPVHAGKLSPTGEERWSKSAKASRASVFTAVATDATGNVYVGGSIDGTFEFARTVSRLEEMQSAAYLAEGHGAA